MVMLGGGESVWCGFSHGGERPSERRGGEALEEGENQAGSAACSPTLRSRASVISSRAWWGSMIVGLRFCPRWLFRSCANPPSPERIVIGIVGSSICDKMITASQRAQAAGEGCGGRLSG